MATYCAEGLGDPAEPDERLRPSYPLSSVSLRAPDMLEHGGTGSLSMILHLSERSRTAGDHVSFPGHGPYHRLLGQRPDVSRLSRAAQDGIFWHGQHP